MSQIGAFVFAGRRIDDAFNVLLEWKIGNWSFLPFTLLSGIALATLAPRQFATLIDAGKALFPFLRRNNG